MQVFEKMQCFYVVTVNRNVSVYYTSRQRQLERTAVVKVGAYIVSIDKKTTVYKLEAFEIAFFENACFRCP